MNNVTFPKIFNLNLRDLGKGFIVTIISTALAVLYNSIEANAFPTGAQLKTALLVGIGTGISYLIKQLMTGIPPVVEVNTDETIVVDEKTKTVLVDKSNKPKNPIL